MPADTADTRSSDEPVPLQAGAGEMAERIRRHDWSRTPLGARAHWPETLQTLVRLMLAAKQPMFMAWGEGQVWLYNDAFIPVLGRKHPQALGRHALDEVWAEARPVLAPLFGRVFAGEAVQMDDFALDLDRRGRLEEAHFAFSYTPARDPSGAVRGLFGVCTETTHQFVGERRRQAVETALSRSAADAAAAHERMDLALRAGAIIGTWVWGVPEDRFVADEQFANSFGLDPELCQAGLPLERVMESIHPDDRERVSAAVQEALGRGGAYRCEYRVLRQDGVYRWTEASGQVEMDVAGLPLRFAGVLVDTEERRRTEEALVQANSLLRTFMAAVPGVIYAKDRAGRLVVGNRGVEELLGLSQAEFVGRTDLEVLEDKAEAAAVMANDRRIMETGIAEQVEERVDFPDGSEAWWHSTKAPLFDEDGNVVGLVGSSVDITARRRAEEHRALLVNELNHRVKNTLTVVQSLARQTFRNAQNLSDASDSFESRLAALSRAHNLLTDEGWASADLRDIVADQVTTHGGQQVRVEGPPVPVAPQVAVSLALALHELCTNAAKYGALSTDGGRVHIGWAIEDGRVRLRWAETGGPRVEPPTRRGFGSRMIERALGAELGGRADIQYRPEGVVCEIEAPLAT